MMNGLLFSYMTGMAYLAPKVPVRTEMCYALTPCASFKNETSWFKKTRSFTYLWDIEHLERHTKLLGIKLEKNEFSCTSDNRIKRKGDWLFLSDAEIIQARFSACRPTWTERIFRGRNTLSKSTSPCYQGLVEYDCMFASFKPRQSHYWGLWAMIRNSFKFSPEILSYADKMVAYIGRPFTSFHLRIEQDVELQMTRIFNWDEFYEVLSVRFRYFNISTADPVVIVSGLAPGDPKRARTEAALAD